MNDALTRTTVLLTVLLTLGGLPPSSPGLAAAQEATKAAAAREATEAEETTVVVRAVAHDAKVIGSGVGGARITIRHAETGEVLARGVQEGGTGSTDRIMRRPHERGTTVYGTEGAAAFRATLELERPTRVEVAAEGPLGTPHATQRASLTTLLLPGRDVTGEGLILELHGFTVELERPGDGAAVPAGEAVPVRAHVTMLCGCPIEPGGLWDADRIDVTARLLRDGRVVREASMSYAGETSTFEDRIRPPGPGSYRLEVVAADADRANFGRVARRIRVR